jgi:folate-binding protein YgfZ
MISARNIFNIRNKQDCPNMQIFAFPNRQLIQVTGADSFSFLQRILSQDLNLLEKQPALYSCLFTAQGRYHFDFIIFKKDDALYIDSTRAADLVARLDMFKMRAAVDIAVIEDSEVYGCFEQGDFLDPRHKDLGYRLYHKPENAEIADYAIWDTKRIELGVFDGEQDAELERSNADELHIDRIHGIDWEKGCYIGQELTARMRYRSGGKKHLYIIQGEDLPAFGEKIGAGVMRSQSGQIGLALLRDSEIDELPYTITKIE